MSEEQPSGDPVSFWRAPITLVSLAIVALALVAAVVIVLTPADRAPPPVETPPAAAEIQPPEPEPDPAPEPASPTPAAPAARKTTSKPKPKAPTEAAPAPAPPGATSTLTLRAVGGSSAEGTIAAKVYVDGKLVGQAPVTAKVAAGTRRIRFDCIFEGKTHRGKDKVIDIPEDTDAEIEHKCDVWVTLGR